MSKLHYLTRPLMVMVRVLASLHDLALTKEGNKDRPLGLENTGGPGLVPWVCGRAGAGP